jgi:hypothetical protein
MGLLLWQRFCWLNIVMKLLDPIKRFVEILAAVWLIHILVQPLRPASKGARQKEAIGSHP